MTYPPDFWEWPERKRDDWFAASAREYREEKRKAAPIIVSPSAPPLVELIRADEIIPEPIRWLWSGWLAQGKLHILGGTPGTGKTTIAMRMASTVTTGGAWPDGSQAMHGNVVIWTGEDDPADTLVPRLIAAGADLERVYFVGGVSEGGKPRAFDPAKDMEPLKRAIEVAGGASMIVIDPIVNVIAGDSHKNSETRRSLQPLVDLASTLDAALLGITHLTKGTAGREPVERIVGSIAFGALARVVMIAAKADGRRVICRAKSNIGPDEDGFAYELQQGELAQHPGLIASWVEWGEVIEGKARDILADAEEQGDAAGGEAEAFLRALLADGPVPATDAKAAADAAGLSWDKVKRAKKSVGVVTEKSVFGGAWVWRLEGSN